jgi:hypothetical protein
MCASFDTPALHTLRSKYDFRTNGKHPHFTTLNADEPTVPRSRFPALKRIEINFRCAETQCIWNCSALKNAFEGYDDLEFMFGVPAADEPMPS